MFDDYRAKELKNKLLESKIMSMHCRAINSRRHVYTYLLAVVGLLP